MRQVADTIRLFLVLALPYFSSADRLRGRLLLAAVVAAELGLVFIAVQVANWNARFFNALEARNWAAFQDELFRFLLIAMAAIVAGMSQYYFGQMLQIRWRRWMTNNYLSVWMAEGRHYRVRAVAPGVDNIHLRIASDVYLFLQRTHELGTGLLGSVVALLSFSWILWGLSARTPFPAFGVDLSFPGYLIVAALTYALVGTLIAHAIGWRLIGLNFNQQRYESDFRFGIVRAADHSEPVALMQGEPVERKELSRRFGTLVGNWTALVARQTKLVGFTAGYGHVSTVVPTLIVSPAYLVGAIPLGTLIQAALAFQRVEAGFAFCISAYAKLAEWRAIMDRLTQMEAAMAAVDASTPRAVSSERPADGALAVPAMALRLPSGEIMAETPALAARKGEHVLVTGPSGAGKSSLFRALVGLWPSAPAPLPRDGVMAMPQQPYFPLGTLRQTLLYPMTEGEADDGALRDALALFGLPHLAHRLDEDHDWSVMLSGGEQQRIGFVRALLRKPSVLLLDEPVSMLDDEASHALFRALTERLPDTIVLTIDRREVLRDAQDRVVTLAPPAARAPPRLNPIPV